MLSQTLNKSIKNFQEKCDQNTNNFKKQEAKGVCEVIELDNSSNSEELIINEEHVLQNLKNSIELEKHEINTQKNILADKSKQITQTITED